MRFTLDEKHKPNKNPMPFRIRLLGFGFLIGALIIGAIAFWSGIMSGARNAMGHAKDIRVALKMISVEYYAGNRSVFDPSSPTGLSDGATEKLRKYCSVDGELILTAWDEVKNIPLSFSYREGRYLVEYSDTGRGEATYDMNGSWIVYYDMKILEYTSDQ